MPNASGFITSNQGTRTLDCTANDTITIAPTAGSFSLEYPIGTVLASGVSATATYTLGPGQCRLTCITGSIAYALTDNPDSSIAISISALSATSGTPGQIVKLMDGNDAGVALVWSIPSGASAYAWCWQIYPLAAY